MSRPLFHIALHFILPAVLAYFFFPKARWKSFLIMSATILVDLDHLLADPVYDPNRPSIPTHTLHSYYAIAVYALILIHPKLRLIGMGLLVHMGLDFIDSLFMEYS